MDTTGSAKSDLLGRNSPGNQQMSGGTVTALAGTEISLRGSADVSPKAHQRSHQHHRSRLSWDGMNMSQQLNHQLSQQSDSRYVLASVLASATGSYKDDKSLQALVLQFNGAGGTMLVHTLQAI